MANDERGPARWSWRRELPLLGLVAAMWIATAVAWPFAEDQIPTHWNARGEVDGYGGKAEGLLLLPGIALAMWALLAFIPKIDPGRRNYASFGNAYFLMRVALLAFFGLLHAGIVALALGADIDIFALFPLGIGVLFIVLGNLMPKFRPNYFAGVRTPWTLASARSWTATHRLAGRLFIVLGVLLAGMVFVREEWMVFVILGGVGLLLVAVSAYSYVVWRNDPDRVPVGQVQPSEEE
ncbi:MAG: SdpI family protein [Chloroflexi bacterium]|nr:SdpI family protein [Chloroflexota bacterium]